MSDPRPIDTTDGNGKNPIPDRTSWKETPWLALKGFLMGSADIIPGVSGGTMALITGIYDRLVHAIRSVDHRLLAALARLRLAEFFRLFHWKFLLILVGGILCAVYFFTRIVPLQLYMHTHPELIYGLFFGLILGSALLLLLEIDPAERSAMRLIPLFLAAAAGLRIVTLVPADTPATFAFLFFSGMLSFTAMILPGISGSYILLLLGKYDYVLARLGEVGGAATGSALWALFPLFLGGVLGLLLFAGLLSWLLRRYHTVTMLILIGFLIGSLYAIWPYQERHFDEQTVQIELRDAADPLVIELQQKPPDTVRPSYRRLGPVLNPDAPPSEQRIEVHTVRRVLTQADPRLPDLSEPGRDVARGGGGMAAGLLLVGGLNYLRRKK